MIVTVAAMYEPTCTTCYSSQLDADWARLRRCRRALGRVRRWAHDHPTDPLSAIIDGIDDLDSILAATQRGVDHDDRILRRLVELARDDELAGRIVVQRLLPGLIARSVRYRSFSDGTDPVEIVVAAAWIATVSFDTEHRRRHVAASLISDAVFNAFRAPLRRRSAGEQVRAPGRFEYVAAAVVEPSPLEELADVIRTSRRAGVPAADLDLLRRLTQVESTATIARERRVTTRTIRNHRTSAVERVRAAIAA